MTHVSVPLRRIRLAVLLLLLGSGVSTVACAPCRETPFGRLPAESVRLKTFVYGANLAITYAHEGKIGLWVNGNVTTGWDAVLGLSHSHHSPMPGDSLILRGKVGSKIRALVNGVPLAGEYDDIWSVVLSPSGRRSVIHARSGGLTHVFVDGIAQPGLTYDPLVAYVSEGSFSPDDRHLTFSTMGPRGWSRVIDGEQGREYEWVGDVIWMAAGGYAYRAGRHDGKAVFVRDGVESPPYLDTRYLYVTPDGRTLAYEAKTTAGWVVVRNGEAEPFVGHDDRLCLILLPDGDVVYRAGRRCDEYVVVRGRAGEHYGLILYLRASKDGRVIAYTAVNDDVWYCVVNGVQGPGFDLVGEPRFAAGANDVIYVGKRGSEWYVFRNHEKLVGPVSKPAEVSEDGRHFAYVREVNGKARVCHDGQLGEEYDGIYDVVLSRDGRSVAYLGRRESSHYVVIDGKRVAMAHGRSVIWPDPDGEGFVYLVGRWAGDEEGGRLVCGSRAKEYDRIFWEWYLESPTTLPGGRLVFWAERGGVAYRVELNRAYAGLGRTWLEGK